MPFSHNAATKLAVYAVYLHCCSGSVLRGDVYLYKIYAYLAILRLTELGVEQFR